MRVWPGRESDRREAVQAGAVRRPRRGIYGRAHVRAGQRVARDIYVSVTHTHTHTYAGRGAAECAFERGAMVV